MKNLKSNVTHFKRHWILDIRYFGKAAFFVFALFFALPVLAVDTSTGGIDSTNKYAWGENIGWLNFGTSEGAVSVSDSALSGYAWGENIGWISLNCSNTSSCATVNYKVANNGAGTLSGYGWGENIGWVNFSPTYGGVTIDGNGNFFGYAWGENIGWIVFNCSTTSSCGTVSYKVNTAYRTGGERSQCNNAADDDGDGAIDYPADTGCESLDDTLELNPGGGGVFVSTGGGGISPVAPAEILPPPSAVPPASEVTAPPQPAAPPAVSPPAPPFEVQPLFPPALPEASPFSIFDRIGEIIRKALPFSKKEEPSLFTPLLPRELPVAPPDSLALQWPLIRKDSINSLVFLPPLKVLIYAPSFKFIDPRPVSKLADLPLPPEVQVLAEKFPAVRETFKKVGIARFNDLEKLQSARLVLPGLNDLLGVAPIGDFGKSLPINALTPSLKMQLPSEVVFAKTAEQAIDFRIGLRVTDQGEVRQRIVTIVNKPLNLSIKPDGSAKTVRGYLVFRSKNPVPMSTMDLHLASLMGRLMFARPVFAQAQDVPVRVEEQLVLLEFEYTDLDGDGIYTATIETPGVDGEYEIITVIDYTSPAKGIKAVRLITVIDPEGYVYEEIVGGKEARIPDARASLFWKNPGTDAYELWPAYEFVQENPQTTDTSGRYSFLVPKGVYILGVQANGYKAYRSEPFAVVEGRGVHINVRLKPEYWLERLPDAKILLLVALIILIVYNFYRDRMREKRAKKMPPSITGEL